MEYRLILSDELMVHLNYRTIWTDLHIKTVKNKIFIISRFAKKDAITLNWTEVEYDHYCICNRAFKINESTNEPKNLSHGICEFVF